MPDIELKPCPFCGGEAEIIRQPGYGDKPYAASCGTGGCMAVIFPFATPEEAAKKWNRRTGNAQTPSEG